MNAPRKKRDLMIGLEAIRSTCSIIGVATPQAYTGLSSLARLSWPGETFLASPTANRMPHPLKALRNDEGLEHRETVLTLKTFLQADFAAIEAEVKDRRLGSVGRRHRRQRPQTLLRTRTGEILGSA